MLLIPTQVNLQSYDLFVALQDDNIERIRQHDPCDVRLHTLPSAFRQLRLREIAIGYASPDDQEMLRQMTERGAHPAQVMALLSRGYTYDPRRGDGGTVIRLPRPQ